MTLVFLPPQAFELHNPRSFFLRPTTNLSRRYQRAKLLLYFIPVISRRANNDLVFFPSAIKHAIEIADQKNPHRSPRGAKNYDRERKRRFFLLPPDDRHLVLVHIFIVHRKGEREKCVNGQREMRQKERKRERERRSLNERR